MDKTENKKSKTSRRNFLETGAATAAGASVFRPKFMIAEESAKGANERIGVGFIGAGYRNRCHIHSLTELQKQGHPVEMVAACDVYAPRAQKEAGKIGGKMYRHHEELLTDPRVDVACIATPDHLHAPQAIDAVRTGKDVFVEKPLAHWSQMDVARQLGEEAKKHGRIVQVGVQMAADASYAGIRKRIMVHPAEGCAGLKQGGDAGLFWSFGKTTSEGRTKHVHELTLSWVWGARLPVREHEV